MWRLWRKKKEKQSEVMTELPELSYRIKEKLWDNGEARYKLEIREGGGEWKSLTSYQWIDIRGPRREKERLEEAERMRLARGDYIERAVE